jgi:glutamate-1-semialdehyde 2,1-aminomutase
MVKRIIMSQGKRLWQEAKRYLVGGVDSPVRSFRYVGGEPLLIKKGRGSSVWDYDGKRYIDYVLSWGSLILGHAHPSVAAAARQALKDGMGFGTTHKSEIDLAQAIHRAIPFIEKIRFVNSGTEAVMGALRLARGVTERDKILKFEGGYHGHADYLLAKAGSGLVTLSIPVSLGVPEGFIKQTLVAALRNINVVEKIFKKEGNNIAAVIVEPVGGNYGVITPDRDFLKGLRQITKRFGALLIFDEVITGFRFQYGSFAQLLAITPDLICLGKIIGGGLPIGAYGGPDKIMKHLTPEGSVYQASTFSGNPVVMQAGISTLKALEKHSRDYKRLIETTEHLSLRLSEEAKRRGIGLELKYFGTMFSLKFADKEHFKLFYRRMLKYGVFFAPSEFEANFLSFAHTQKDIEKTIKFATQAFDSLKFSL